MHKWPFKFPSVYKVLPTLDGQLAEKYRDACVTVALKWAAEQCIKQSKRPACPEAAQYCADRILAAIQKE